MIIIFFFNIAFAFVSLAALSAPPAVAELSSHWAWSAWRAFRFSVCFCTAHKRIVARRLRKRRYRPKQSARFKHTLVRSFVYRCFDELLYFNCLRLGAECRAERRFSLSASAAVCAAAAAARKKRNRKLLVSVWYTQLRQAVNSRKWWKSGK